VASYPPSHSLGLAHVSSSRSSRGSAVVIVDVHRKGGGIRAHAPRTSSGSRVWVPRSRYEISPGRPMSRKTACAPRRRFAEVRASRCGSRSQREVDPRHLVVPRRSPRRERAEAIPRPRGPRVGRRASATKPCTSVTIRRARRGAPARVRVGESQLIRRLDMLPEEGGGVVIACHAFDASRGRARPSPRVYRGRRFHHDPGGRRAVGGSPAREA